MTLGGRNGPSRRLSGGGSDLARARSALRAGLESRRAEIEHSLLTRVYAISDPGEADPAYLEGLRGSVAVALDYALEAIEHGEDRSPPPPPALRAQARMAARSGIGLDTVLRRYFAGYALLGEFLAQEAAAGGLPEEAVPGQSLQGFASALFDQLLAAVSEEYEQERASHPDSSEQRHVERIERLLAGESLETAGIGYNFEGHHIGLVVNGYGAPEAIRALASALDRRLLLVRRSEENAWAWLGGQRPLNSAEVERQVGVSALGKNTFAVGESAMGLAGWRLTYRQAAVTLPIALRRRQGVTCYTDFAVIASILQDDVLMASLRQLYLDRLDDHRGDGAVARETLRAYFAADCNVSSAAAALGVNRHTVASRLRAIEERLDRPLSGCRLELDAALRLEDIVASTDL